MLIQMIIMLLAPAVLSVYLYERFKGYNLTTEKRIALMMIFALIINMIVYAAIWLRGWERISWTFDSSSELRSVSFCLKYMALSIAFAVILPFAASLIKVSKRK